MLFWVRCFVAVFVACVLVESRSRYTSAASGDHGSSSPISGSNSPPVEAASPVMKKTLGSIQDAEVLRLIDGLDSKFSIKLKESQMRLERQLLKLQEHFDSIMVKLKKTEDSMEEQLKQVENVVTKSMLSSAISVQSNSTSWRWPFFFLVIVMMCFGLYFVRLYNKVTKGRTF